MLRWVRAASRGVAVLVSLSMLVAPVAAQQLQNAVFYMPPAGMTLTEGTSTNGLMLEVSTRLDAKYLRQVVRYETSERSGVLVVDTRNHFLYFTLGGGKALRYGIGVARDGFEWSGTHQITRKAEWPSWTPPAEMLKRRPDLPRFMEGGPDNPLGARALYIGSTLYRIHGTNEPWSIGQNVSSGCIRMINDDVIDLYSRVKIGSKVVVL